MNITAENNGSNDAIDPVRAKLKGRPSVDINKTNLDTLSKLLSVDTSSAKTQREVLALCIQKLEEVPYIPYPVSLSTVDMIGVTYKMVEGKRKTFVLMGRRSPAHLWQFPGGFRDPRETDEVAAQREYLEEVSINIPMNRIKRVGQLFIDDRRYRSTPHKVTTAIHLIHVLAKEAKLAQAADDIFEVKWFDVDYLRQNRDMVVRDVHMGLFNFIEKHLK